MYSRMLCRRQSIEAFSFVWLEYATSVGSQNTAIVRAVEIGRSRAQLNVDRMLDLISDSRWFENGSDVACVK